MITVPGFLASGVSSGIKENTKLDPKLDLGLIFSPKPAKAAAVFTKNVVKAAPVLLGMERIKKGLCQAIVVNSGNANAGIGAQGMEHSRAVSKWVADSLGIDEGMVIPSSTGKIGVPLPIEKIKNALAGLTAGLSEDGFERFARAIMTTDRFPKFVAGGMEVGGKKGALCVVAKGAGMIAPDMATMLAYTLTDIDVEPSALRKALKTAVDATYNKIIVDGDTSTNDTAIMLSSGALGNEPLREGDAEFAEFVRAVTELNYRTAHMIVKDGEGATKVAKIVVRGARTQDEAARVAKTVGGSLLVKTALYGEDPNWGRFLAAAGRAGVEFDPNKIDLRFNDLLVIENGAQALPESAFEHVFKEAEFTVTLDLKSGGAESFVLTCDIGAEYVKLNSLYST